MKRSFFNRVLLTYSFIVCLLILACFSGFLLYIQYDTKERLEAYSDESFSAYAMSCDNAFKSMQLMAQKIKSLRTLDQFAFSSHTTYYPQMTALFQDLQEFASLANNVSSSGSYTFVAHKSGDDTAVSSLSSLSLSSLLDQLKLSPAFYRSVIDSLHSSRNDRFILTDEKIIYLTQKDYVGSRMIVGVYADRPALNLYPIDPDMHIEFQVEDDKMIDLRTGLPSPLSFPEEGTGRALQESRIEGVSYRWMRSSRLDLTYYYYLTEPPVAIQTASLLLRMGILVVAVCLLAFGMIALFSVRLYRPIERLIDTFLSFEVNDNPSKDFQNEMDYIAQNVVEIRSRNQELVAKLEENASTLKTDLVNSILQDTCNQDTLMDDLKKYQLEWLDGATVPVLFELPEELIAVLDEQIRARYTAEKVLNYSGRLCFIIQDPDLHPLKEALQEIVTFIDTAFFQGITAYVGQRCCGIAELRPAFVAVNRIVENKRRMPPRSVYDYNDYLQLPAEIIVYPIHNELKLIEAVEQGDEKEVRRLLDYIFEEYAQRAFQTNEGRDLFTFALVNTVNRILQQMGLDMKRIVQPDEMVFLEFKLCESSGALRDYTLRLFDRILEAVQSTQVQKAENLEQQLKAYIAANLQTDLSLLTLAEHFNLSPNYMSTLFKSTMQDNFKDYISKIRFERAVELLKGDPDMKLSALGEQVGIGNVNTLIRIFKKFSGLSPGQYIREHLSGR
ncbi:MAG: helix-turn-helix domain-containing protein [Provencibacterium sp.]|jgi:AraC-like DNA-binding protein|nr:helix-turn-helix domain-containing protein [Provencibacterium sp.]